MTTTLDRNELMEMIDHDLEILAEMVESFKEEAPRYLDDLDQAIVQQDARGVKLASHTLRGALLQFCAEQAASTAQALESRSHTGNLEGAEPLAFQLRREIELVLHLLAEILQGS